MGLEVRLACDTLGISSVARSQHPRPPHSLTFSVAPQHNLCPCLAKASSHHRLGRSIGVSSRRWILFHLMSVELRGPS